MRPTRHRRLLAALCTAGSLVAAGPALAADLLPSTPDPGPVTDGTVLALARDGSTLYLGGQFERVAPATGPLLLRASDTGRGVRGPTLAGSVSVAIPDGGGGWYVGGSIRTADGTVGVVRVTAAGVVDAAFEPLVMTPTSVAALALDAAGHLYVGGNFSNIGGVSRRSLVRLDASTGAVDATWGAGVSAFSGAVSAIAVSGSTVYLGGSFGCIGTLNADPDCSDPGEASRRSAGAVSVATGAAVAAWAPEPNLAVSDIEVDGSTVYLAGIFDCLQSADTNCDDVGDVTRRGVAAVTASTGAPLAFRLDVGNPTGGGGGVVAVTLAGASIYVAGEFRCAGWNGDADCSDAGEVARSKVVRGARTTGALDLAWDPPVFDGDATDVAVSGGNVWVGGSFTAAGASPRHRLAALSPTTAALLPQAIEPTGAVATLAATSTRLLVGGSFAGAGGVARRNLAAIDLRTGQATGWAPNPDDLVGALLVARGQLHVGGSFSAIAGLPRSALARFALPAGTLTSWSPGTTDGFVRALAVGPDGTTYAGGSFSQLGGDGQFGLGAIRDDATAIPAFPAALGQVNALALSPDGGTLYVGGSFAQLGADVRFRIGAVPTAGGPATSFAPLVNGEVNALVVSGDALYLGGAFGSVDGVARGGVARLSRATGALSTGFEAPPFVTVSALALAAGRLAVGGAVVVDGTADGVLLVDRATGAADPFRPRVSGAPVAALAGTASAVSAAFSGFSAGLLPRSGVATWTPAPSVQGAVTVNPRPRQGLAATCAASFRGDAQLAYTWLRAGSPIAGATTKAYTPKGADVKRALACRVVATNIRGTATATSAARVVRSRVVTKVTLQARKAPGVTISGRVVTLPAGQRLRIRGRLTGAGGGAARAVATISRRPVAGGPLRRIGKATANLTGRYAFRLPRLTGDQVIIVKSGGRTARLTVRIR